MRDIVSWDQRCKKPLRLGLEDSFSQRQYDIFLFLPQKSCIQPDIGEACFSSAKFQAAMFDKIKDIYEEILIV